MYLKTTTITDMKLTIIKATTRLTLWQQTLLSARENQQWYMMREGTAFLKDQFSTAGEK